MKPFTKIAAGFLFLISALHLLRLVTGWEVMLAGRTVAMWVSAPAAVLIGGLAAMVWRESSS